MTRPGMVVLSFVVSAVLAFGPACRPQSVREPTWMTNAARRPGVDLIVVFTPEAPKAEKLIRAVRSELSNEFDVQVYPAGRRTNEYDIAQVIYAEQPKAVIVVDNPTVRLYGKWARRQQSPPPSIIVMSSFASQLQRSVPNSMGISFETPAVTSLTDLRRLLDVPIERVGVVYRSGFETYVERETQRAAFEKITLVTERVGAQPTSADIHRALERLRDAEVDALWVSNDNGLLESRMLHDAWFPFVQRNQLPVVVGVPSLVSAQRTFGTFAVVPDVEGIGLQAADLIFSLADHGWQPLDMPVQPPVSVKTIVHRDSARRLGMSSRLERTVDVLVARDE